MIAMLRRTFAFLALLLLAVPVHAAEPATNTAPPPAEGTGIIAIVNDEAITNIDVSNRVNLIFLSSGLQNDPENRKRVSDRVLRNLIDEKLQMQEAKRYDISVEEAEINRALGVVARQNQMELADLENFMATRDVPRETLTSQIRASLSWSKVVSRVLRAQVEVANDEVSAMLERIQSNEGKPEYLMSEIFLAVENPSDDAKIADLANNLIERMKAGTSFAALAQQFSQGTGAISGGDLGWIQPGQMTGDLDKAVRNLAVGQVSLPIRTADGYFILAKRQERIISASDPKAVQLRLKQASLPLHGKSLEEAKGSIDGFRMSVATCNALDNAKSQFPDWTVQDIGAKRVGELPGWLASIAASQRIDQPSAPMEKGGYAMLLYVCERNSSGSDRAAIMNAIGTEKLEQQARRLLRDLRRSASIDIRGS